MHNIFLKMCMFLFNPFIPQIDDLIVQAIPSTAKALYSIRCPITIFPNYYEIRKNNYKSIKV